MMEDIAMHNTLAILGGEPAFPERLHFGQHYFPIWERYEASFHDIFERQYYTNHGPLAQRLESALGELLGVKHAICVTNGMIALCMATQAQELRGKVIVPAWTNSAIVEAVVMAGLDPVFCDVDHASSGLTAAAVEPLLAPDVGAILASNTAGGACDVAGLAALAERAGKALYFDSAQALGCRIGGQALGSFGRLEVLSLHSRDIVSATEGAVVCTNDDAVAAKVRNIRGNYGRGHFVPVIKTGNGRMSEAQAAIALANLADLDAHVAHNKALHQAYRAALERIPGVCVRQPSGVDASNHQCLSCEIDASRLGLDVGQLAAVLRAENVETGYSGSEGCYACVPAGQSGQESEHAFPVAHRLAASTIQLPIGAQVDAVAVERISSILADVAEQPEAIRAAIARDRASSSLDYAF